VTSEPEVSIVVCTRNRAGSLNGTLASLAQIRSERPWEALLVDNASTDDTAKVIDAADDCGGRLRHLYEARPGLGAARDGAWRQAKGRLICFTDDDCYLAPDYVDAISEAFRRRPHLGCLGGRILLFDPQDARVTIDERDAPSEIAPYRFMPAGALQGANLSFRRETLERIGGFDPSLGAGTPFPCEDVDAVAATLWAGIPVGFDPGPVVFHHHGRRAADLEAVFEGYDRGRGAYYAKYLLRRDTRSAYFRAWMAIVAKYVEPAELAALRREFRAARAYLEANRRTDFLLLAAPVAFLAYARARMRIARLGVKQELRALIKGRGHDHGASDHG